MTDKGLAELEERTLVVKNFDPNETTKELLEELFSNFGPIKNVVLKRDFAFIGYTKKDSVAYALAMMTGIRLHGRRLSIHPKLSKQPYYYKYVDALKRFEQQSSRDDNFSEQFLDKKQRSEKMKTLEDYGKSHRKRSQIQDRLRRYRRHYDDADAKFNPYFGQNLGPNDHYCGHDHHSSRSQSLLYDKEHRRYDSPRYDRNVHRQRINFDPRYEDNRFPGPPELLPSPQNYHYTQYDNRFSGPLPVNYRFSGYPATNHDYDNHRKTRPRVESQTQDRRHYPSHQNNYYKHNNGNKRRPQYYR